jgi:hypothetical protein
VLLAVDLHFGAAVLAEEDAVAGLHVEGADLAVFLDLAVADGDDFTLDRLLLRRVRDDDPALGLLFFLHTLHDHAVLQGANFGHGSVPLPVGCAVFEDAPPARPMRPLGRGSWPETM